jgi:hypothetical protein
LTVFASALGWVACSTDDIRTSNVADCRFIAGTADQFRQSPNLFVAWIIFVAIEALRVVDDIVASICTTHEFSKPRIVSFQSVTNNRPTLRIDRRVV